MAHARRLRLAAVAAVLAWFFVPDLRRAVPIWVPFVLFAALEVNFFVAGLREGHRPRAKRGRPPQASDIAELGGEEWLEPVLLEVEGHEVWIPSAVDEAAEREPSEPRGRRNPWVARLEGLAVLTLLALAVVFLLPEGGWGDLDRSEQRRTEELLSRVAAEIAGHEVAVHCDAEGEAVGIVQHADGLAEVGGRNAYLTPAICYRLHRLAFDGEEGPFSGTARAVAVLAHEAWHLRGVADEGVTNCYAFQSGVALGEELGLSRATAARMMRQQLAESAIQAQAAPRYLVPPGCRNGGEYDLDPSRDPFP